MALRVAVLASGEGSTLQAMIEARDAGQLDVDFVGLFSDKPGARAVERALAAGMPVCALSPKGFDSRIEHDRALFARVEQVQPELIVCAGYMRIISAEVAQRFERRMINLHPSLLPKFRGLHTHRQCLDAGDAVHGASVHWVTAELDGGPVIAQARVPVHAGDDERTLEARVRQVERPLLLATMRALASGRVRHGDAIRFLDSRFELSDSEVYACA
ncbi:phosphoribosylglycinamide formyltransferase [Aquimonas voraii]|uniref:Phosphoribosylglycinamide formyltransferase n=1 Tax=Aquimonas voraii TaxID=265719 RepID=A0A1G6S0L2_9GAMM|nr:phosphoribosylglycinamide formyltransferase [Aquimonas voraii]SDD10399.1 formyltetrahydrofolate-dependent phosphoribosylglycinamide formyltransferase [Aquimonas voraii]